ncbi:MAG TPA: hypothetical protein VMU77_04110, partial [Acidimicrobiales bacterium]|nr:hypothetical protein [Acidimicrobiales bacterium]
RFLPAGELWSGGYLLTLAACPVQKQSNWPDERVHGMLADRVAVPVPTCQEFRGEAIEGAAVQFFKPGDPFVFAPLQKDVAECVRVLLVCPGGKSSGSAADEVVADQAFEWGGLSPI